MVRSLPDEEMPEGYTVADPVEPEGATVPIERNETRLRWTDLDYKN